MPPFSRLASRILRHQLRAATLALSCISAIAILPSPARADSPVFHDVPTFNPSLEKIATPHYIAHQPGRGILVSGGFTLADNKKVTSFLRLLPDGTVDPTFQPAIPGGGRILVQDDGKALALDGNSIVRLLPDGALDPSFTRPHFLSPNGFSSNAAMAVSPLDGSIRVAGFEITIEGVNTALLYRILPSGTVDPESTIPIQVPTDISGGVNTIKILPTGEILLGGNFFAVNGVPRTSIAKISPTGDVVPEFNPQLTASPMSLYATVTAIEPAPDGNWMIAGDFATVNGTSSPGLARLDADGQSDPTFLSPLIPLSPFSSVQVTGLAVRPNGNVIASGQFRWNGAPLTAARLAEFSPTGTPIPTFDISGGEGNPLLLPDGKLLANIYRISASVVPGLVRLNENGDRDPAFTANLAARTTPEGLTVHDDGTILVWSPLLAKIDGKPTGNLAALDQSGTLVNGQFLNGITPVGLYDALALPGGSTLAIGNFLHGDTRLGAILFDPSGNPIPGFSIPGNTWANTFGEQRLHRLPDGTVLVSGVAGVGPYATPQLMKLDPRQRIDPSHAPVALEILEARFGNETNSVDVTETLRAKQTGDTLTATASASALGITNPSGGTNQLTIHYQNSAGTFTARVRSGAQFSLPWPAIESGLIDTGFNPPLHDLARLDVIAVGPAGQILVTGRTSTAPQISLLAPNGELLRSFDPATAFTTFDSNSAAFLKGGEILLAGNFRRVGSATAETLLRLSADLTVRDPLPFHPGTNPSNLTRLADGRILLTENSRISLLSNQAELLAQYESTARLNFVELTAHRNQFYIFGIPFVEDDSERHGLLRIDLETVGNTPPLFTTHPASQQISSGNPATLAATISSDNPVSIRWWKNGLPIPGEEDPTLHLNPTNIADAAQYRAEATSLLGNTFSSPAHLRVTENYETWANRLDLPGPLAPDAHGIPHLLHYALNLPAPGIASPWQFLTDGAQFQIPGSTENLTYWIAESTDLQTWQRHPLEEYPHTTIYEDPLGNRRVAFTQPPNSPRLFLRLQITLNTDQQNSP